MSNQTPLNHQCVICGKWYKPDPQMAGIACAVFHSPGSCCHYSEIEVVTPPMPDKTPDHLPTCDAVYAAINANDENGIKGKPTDYYEPRDFIDLCNCGVKLHQEAANATPPTEPQEVEALKELLQDMASMYDGNLTNGPDAAQVYQEIKAIIARERTSAAIDELTAFKDLAMVYSDGSPANMIVMDEEEAVTYIDDRIAALTAQQKGEQ